MSRVASPFREVITNASGSQISATISTGITKSSTNWRITDWHSMLESWHLHDPLGRRAGKRVWRSRCESLYGREYLRLNPPPEMTWYGWDGDRLTTTQTAQNRVQRIYEPGSFTPLVRVETELTELAKSAHRSLVEKLQQNAGMTFVPELVALLDGLEQELRRGDISAGNLQWLAQCGLTPEQMKNQLEPEYTPAAEY